MLLLDHVKDLPTSNRFGDGAPWVKCLPYPAPVRWRLRDAWEVFMGRAQAVREIKTLDELIACYPLPDDADDKVRVPNGR